MKKSPLPYTLPSLVRVDDAPIQYHFVQNDVRFLQIKPARAAARTNHSEFYVTLPLQSMAPCGRV